MTEIRARYNDIIRRLENRAEKNYSIREIEILVDDILKATRYYNDRGATQIVRISRDFGIKSYKERLEFGIVGKLFVNGDTKNIYEWNQIILVNENEDFFYQRFILARELACFLLNYIGSEEYEQNMFFSDLYSYKDYSSKDKQKVDRFATSILMPRELFKQEYIRASKEGKGNRMFLLIYLSKFFEVPTNLVERRIIEILDY